MLTKHTTSEAVDVLDPKEKERIEKELHRMGKTSAKKLTKDERRKVFGKEHE